MQKANEGYVREALDLTLEAMQHLEEARTCMKQAREKIADAYADGEEFQDAFENSVLRGDLSSAMSKANWAFAKAGEVTDYMERIL